MLSSESSSQFPCGLSPDAPQPPLVVTAGSRESIGAEVLSKAWRFWAQRHQGKGGKESPCFLSLGGRKEDFEAFSIPCRRVSGVEEARAHFPLALPLLDEGLAARASIDAAVRLCAEGKACGVVTLPVEKEIFSEQPRNPSALSHDEHVLWGHTEYIATALGVERYGMLLAWRGLRTLPVTRHVALRHAVAMLDKTSVLEAARMAHRALKEDFGIQQPRLAVAGLNPHAGEGGACGDEEKTILQPAVARLCKEGIATTGPHPSDSLFLPRLRKTFDCALTLYHDQGLIPLKLLSNQQAVNITLGLPIVRCSPDHGTARDIVGRGIADAGSLTAALAMAWRIAKTRRERTTQKITKEITKETTKETTRGRQGGDDKRTSSHNPKQAA